MCRSRREEEEESPADQPEKKRLKETDESVWEERQKLDIQRKEEAEHRRTTQRWRKQTITGKKKRL